VRPLSTAELLRAWELGEGRSPAEQALTLLAAACDDHDRERLAELSVGRRDGLLASLREQTFGGHLVGLTACPACGERLELSFELADVRVDPPDGDAAPVQLARDGYRVAARLPNGADLQAAAAAADPAGARLLLLERCLLSGRRGRTPVAAADLPERLVAELMAAMAEQDPQADVRLALACAACGHGWLAAFDIAAWFWRELAAWARRTLQEVHVLASSYGWRERDILAMSQRRRWLYLELAAG
jgi:catechol 2,3-dioxygenase-like lactoylglutathione lyase family enzyme